MVKIYHNEFYFMVVLVMTGDDCNFQLSTFNLGLELLTHPI